MSRAPVVPSSAMRLGVKPAAFYGEGDSVKRHHIGGNAVVDVVLGGVGDDVVETVHHDFFQPLVNQILIPEVALPVLNPLEVGDRDAARVGQNVGDHEDFFLRQNRVGE